MIGSGVDFDSNPITVTFGVGEVSKRVNISVMIDHLLEEEESFVISLTTNDPQVVLSRFRAFARIIDSTGIKTTYM